MNELPLLWSASSPSIIVATAMMTKPPNTLMLARAQPSGPSGSEVCVGGPVTLGCDSFGTSSDGSVSKSAERLSAAYTKLSASVERDSPEHQST